MRYTVSDSNAAIPARNAAEVRERLRTWYQDGFADSSGDFEGLEELACGSAAVGKTEARGMALADLAGAGRYWCEAPLSVVQIVTPHS